MGNNRGFGANLIAAIVMAAIGLVIYYSQVEENPVTGERQHVTMSPAQEIRLGLQSAPGVVSEMGGELPASDPYSLVVKKVGQFLVENTLAKNSPWQFQFHVLGDTQVVNALALPGGQIFITLGLLDKLQTEAELAGVLSHEMGHVIERHSAEQMAKSQLGQAIVMAVGVGASDPNNPRSSMDATMLASFVNNIISLRYSRKDESEADLWGLKLMEQAGFDPRAMIEVMQVLKQASGGGQSIEMFQTHPNPDLRIQDIEAYLKAHPPKEGLSEGENLSVLLRQQGGDLGRTSKQKGLDLRDFFESF